MTMLQEQYPPHFWFQLLLNFLACFYFKPKKTKETRQHFLFDQGCFQILFWLGVVILNYWIYFWISPHNFYQELKVKRFASYENLENVKKSLTKQRIQLEMEQLQYNANILRKREQMAETLLDSSSRLIYDVTGKTKNQYKSSLQKQSMIPQTIMNSSFFYLACATYFLTKDKEEEMKQAAKIQVFIIILFLLTDMHLIKEMKTCFCSSSILVLDSIFPEVLIFQFRFYLKMMLFPYLELLKLCYRSSKETEFIKLTENKNLKEITKKAQEQLHKKLFLFYRADIYLEDRLSLAIDIQLGSTQLAEPAQIWGLQREIIKTLLFLEKNELFEKNYQFALIRYKFMIPERSHHTQKSRNT